MNNKTVKLNNILYDLIFFINPDYLPPSLSTFNRLRGKKINKSDIVQSYFTSISSNENNIIKKIYDTYSVLTDQRWKDIFVYSLYIINKLKKMDI